MDQVMPFQCYREIVWRRDGGIVFVMAGLLSKQQRKNNYGKDNQVCFFHN